MRRAQPSRAAQRTACVALLAALLAWPASAPAQSAEVSGYAGAGPTTQHQIELGHRGSPAGTLPFTGLDAALVLATAAGLLGVGIALRRGADRTPSDA